MPVVPAVCQKCVDFPGTLHRFQMMRPKSLLKQLEGTWQVISYKGPGSGVLRYQDVSVQDGYSVLSGAFPLLRGPTWEIYFDCTGSMLTKLDAPGGEVEIESSLGALLLSGKEAGRRKVCPKTLNPKP